MSRPMLGLLAGAVASVIAQAGPLHADFLVEKKPPFEILEYKTVGGSIIKNVRIGWESYGELNNEKSNAILITHHFSGTSHAGGQYRDGTKGYWNAIIGPGKPLDTKKYFILSSDTLVNLNAKDPTVITTGPATKNPATGQPYGRTFPIVTIRDFVNVQRALVERLGITKLHAVMGASMGALQAYEWAASYPGMVGKLIPVIGAGEADGWTIASLHMWAAPIVMDPNWRNGDYYGKAEPVAGLATALSLVTLQAQHWTGANHAFGRKWAIPGQDPASCLVECQYAIEAALDATGKARLAKADANHFLYLVKAGQLFVAGGGNLADGLKKIKAPVLLISSDEDLIFPPEAINQTAGWIRGGGTPVEQVRVKGDQGHLDGVLAIDQAGHRIREFLDRN